MFVCFKRVVAKNKYRVVFSHLNASSLGSFSPNQGPKGIIIIIIIIITTILIITISKY